MRRKDVAAKGAKDSSEVLLIAMTTEYVLLTIVIQIITGVKNVPNAQKPLSTATHVPYCRIPIHSFASNVGRIMRSLLIKNAVAQPDVTTARRSKSRVWKLTFVPCAKPDITSTVKNVTPAGVIASPLMPVLLNHDVIQSPVTVSTAVCQTGTDQCATSYAI